MINKTVHTLFFAIALTIFLGGFFSTTLNAADTKKKQVVQLDQLHAGNDITCADCHGDDNQRKAVSMLKCLECHDTKELAEETADYKPTNPHKNRHYNTGADCNLCHHQHKKSKNFCLPCHEKFDFIVP